MMNGSVELGAVKVFTTDSRGFTPEEMADRAAYRLLRINNRSELKRVLEQYFKEAQDSERMNLRRKLDENGYSDAAKLLGD
jgi:hypothetical protein